MRWSCRDYAIRHEGEACRGIVVTAFPVLRYQDPARGLTIVRLARRFGGDRVGKLQATISGIKDFRLRKFE